MALVAVLLVLGDASAGASSGVVIKEPQYGFSLTLPVNWKQVPLNGNDVTALLNAETHDDPALTNALNSEVTSAAAEGMKVFAIGPVAGSTVPNLNVIVTSSAGVPTGSAFAPVAVAEAKIELTQVGASHLKTSIVEDRLGTSARATYELILKNAAPRIWRSVLRAAQVLYGNRDSDFVQSGQQPVNCPTRRGQLALVVDPESPARRPKFALSLARQP